jgi:hypothetical protein
MINSFYKLLTFKNITCYKRDVYRYRGIGLINEHDLLDQ